MANQGYGADATLVNAAYRMGMANVPADTSKIFKQQYEALAGIETARLKMWEDITKSTGDLLETGIETYAKIEGEKEWNEKLAKYDDLSKNNLENNAKNWDNYKNENAPPRIDDDTIAHSKSEIVAMRDEIDWFEDNAKTEKQKTQLSRLKARIPEWRNENNKMLASYDYQNKIWANDDVDMRASFSSPNPVTGEVEFSADFMNLYNQVMDPAIKLGDCNIERARHPKTGQIGYKFNPNDDRLAQIYKVYKDNESLDVVEGGERDDAGVSGDGRTSWISHDELIGMVKLKDKDLPLTLNGAMTTALSKANKTNSILTQNPDGTVVKSKNFDFAVNDYSEVSAINEAKFYDILMSRTRDDGSGKSVPRDPRQGIIYMSNNETLVGNSKVNYGEHSKLNPSINKASYASLGLSGSVDKDGNGVLDTDELTAEDKKIVHNRLMNPQTEEETRIAAKELAHYFNLQTEAKFNSDRGNLRKTPPKTIKPIKNKIRTTKTSTGSNVNKQFQSFKDQDTKLDKAMRGETLTDWSGNKFTTNDGGKTYTGPGNYGTESVYDLLTGTQFGMEGRIGERALDFGQIKSGKGVPNLKKEQGLSDAEITQRNLKGFTDYLNK